MCQQGKTSEVTFVDYEKPGLEIIKKNIANGEPIEGVTTLLGVGSTQKPSGGRRVPAPD